MIKQQKLMKLNDHIPNDVLQRAAIGLRLCFHISMDSDDLKKIPVGWKREQIPDHVLQDDKGITGFRGGLYSCDKEKLMCLTFSYHSVMEEGRSLYNLWRLSQLSKDDKERLPKIWFRSFGLCKHAIKAAQEKGYHLFLGGGSLAGSIDTLLALKYRVPAYVVNPADLGEKARLLIPKRNLKRAHEYVSTLRMERETFSPRTEIVPQAPTEKRGTVFQEMEDFDRMKFGSLDEVLTKARASTREAYLWRQGSDGFGLSACPLGKEYEIYPLPRDEGRGTLLRHFLDAPYAALSYELSERKLPLLGDTRVKEPDDPYTVKDYKKLESISSAAILPPNAIERKQWGGR